MIDFSIIDDAKVLPISAFCNFFCCRILKIAVFLMYINSCVR